MMIKNIGKTCNITTGKLDANKAVINGEYPFFTCAPFPERIDNFAFDDDVVLVAGNNANGNFHVSRFKGKFNAYQRTYVLTAKKGEDIDYVYYSLKLELKRLRERSQGSQTKFLTMPILMNIVMNDIEYDDQKAISSILGRIDKKIELNNKINKELEALAKLIYDYWFVQFDFPDNNGKPYKSSGGKMVFNKNLKREIPVGWKSIPISNILNIKTGKEDANFANPNGKYAFFTCGEKILSCDDYAFEGKAILLAGNGTFGIKRYAGKFNAYQRTYVLIPNKESHFPLVYYSVKAQAQQLTDGSRGSIVKFITIGDIKDINLILPPDPSVCSTELLNNLFDESDTLIKENEELAKLRDWLLPMLMNGQVSVNEAN